MSTCVQYCPLGRIFRSVDVAFIGTSLYVLRLCQINLSPVRLSISNLTRTPYVMTSSFVTNYTYCLDFFSKSLTPLMRNNFPKRPSDSWLHTFSELYDVPLVLYPLPHLRQCISLFAVAKGWLSLDIG